MDEKARAEGAAPLDDVMLAMDVVDTLRYRGSLVDRELGSDDRERILIERLRDLYGSQGIEVPDHILAEGVAALREDRFVYRPPAPSLAVRIAHVYVERWKWARRTSIVLAVVCALLLAFHFGVTVPERRRLGAEARELNAAIDAAVERRETVSRDVDRLLRALPTLRSDAASLVAARAEAEAVKARGSLDEAEALLATAAALGRPEALTAGTATTGTATTGTATTGTATTGTATTGTGSRGTGSTGTSRTLAPAARRWLERQGDLLDRAAALAREAERGAAAIRSLSAAAAKAEDAWTAFREASVDAEALAVGEAIHGRAAAALRLGDFAEAEAQSAILSGLKVRIEDLRAARDAVAALSRVPEAASRAQKLYADGVAGLRAGEPAAAAAAAAALGDLKARLDSEYTIRIVSRPGESSGLWRIPDRNPSARNYYVIVEAIGPGGRPMRLPIRSEEDGRTSVVRQWGLRVSERVFDGVRKDKEEDGILQKDVVGVKRRGFLEPEYALPVEGGAITSW